MQLHGKKLLITTQAVDLDDPILGFFHEWIVEFAKDFEHVNVICLRQGRHTLPHNVTVHSLGKEEGAGRCTYVIRFYKYFSKAFFHDHVDYVFFHMGAVYNILAIPFFFFRTYYKTSFFWWKAHGHINFVGRVASWFVDSIYTASKESFPLESSRRKIIGHAIPIPPSITSTLVPIKEKVRIICVSRISKRKKIEVALQVAHILKGTAVPFELTVVGPVTDAPYMDELQGLIKEYDIEDNVTFTGGVPHHVLSSLYRKTDILLHPSETGSIDKVVLEAISEGVVPLALCEAYGALTEPFDLCVTENTGEQYYKKMTSLFAMSLHEYNHVRSELYEKVAKNHSLSTLTERIFTTNI